MIDKKRFKFFRRNKDSNTDINEHLPISPISKSLDKNIKELIHYLGDSTDIIVRRFEVGKDKPVKAAIIYTDGLVNVELINDFLKVLFTLIYY